MTARIGVGLAVLLLAACSTARNPYPYKIDHGTGDGGVVARDGTPGDYVVQSDQTLPGQCEAKCTSQAAFLCVSDSASKFCVECVSSAQCVANPASAGPICDIQKKLCECATDADCAGKEMGGKCHANDKVCSCVADSDCSGGRRCIGNFYGTKVCKAPCQTNADCAANMFEQVCDLSTGCQECTKLTGCGPGSLGKVCTNGLCTCSGNADCATNLNGQLCIKDSNVCGCENDFDCPSGKACTGIYIGNRLCK